MKASLISALVLFGQTVTANAQLSVAPGDLLAAFYRINAAGSGVEPNTYIVNLGPGSAWRDNSTDNVSVTNIGADMVETFGADWFDSSRLRWTIVGAIDVTEPTTNGDPPRTTYFSRGGATYSPTATSAPTFSSTNRGSLTNGIVTFTLAMVNKPTAVNPKGAVVPADSINNVTKFVPPASSTYFNVGTSSVGSFASGALGASDTYNVEGALDIYRTLHSAAGATLTAGMAAGNAVVGTGQKIGTFTIDATGQIRLDVPSAPVATGYASWAQRQSLTGADAAGSADPDMDGVKNGMEFVVGGNPKVPDADTKSPSLAISGGNLEFVFRLADEAAFLNPTVQTDTDLVGPWTTLVNGTNGVTVVVDNDGFGAGVDRVTVRVPMSTTDRLFARLIVTIP